MKSVSLLIATVAMLIATVSSSAIAGTAKTVQAVSPYIESPEVVGHARLKFMLWDVFDATLIASHGLYDPNKPFALSLTYLRNLSGRKIVEKTIEEISSQGMASTDELREWRSQLDAILPNVSKSTTITAVRDAQAHTLLFRSDTLIGMLEDPKFTRLFFNIWLGEHTSNPDLRDELLNAPQS